jgi:hypothetical protein
MKPWKMVTVAGIACVACCAPLIAPAVGAALASAGLAGLGAGLFGVSWPQLICIGVVAGGVAFVAWRFLAARRRQAAAPSCEVGGPCDPTAGRPSG